MGLLLGGFYALAVTYARGGYIAMGLVLFVLASGWMLRGKRVAGVRSLTYVVVGVLLVILIVAPILGGQFAQSRLAQIGHDAGVRMAHWQNALAIKKKDWQSELFGMGLGSYPVTYFYFSHEKARSATYSYFQHGGEHGVSLGQVRRSMWNRKCRFSTMLRISFGSWRAAHQAMRGLMS